MIHNGDREYFFVDPENNEMLNLYKKLSSIPYFNGDEQGVYHPHFHQVLKMRSNKMADLFVDNNVGVRLDPVSQSINFFANHLKNHVDAISSWVTGDMVEYIKGSKTTKVNGNVTIEVGGNASIIVNGNVDAKIKENATISVDKDVSIKGRNVDIQARDTLHLEGNTILVGLEKADDHNAARWYDYYEYDEDGRRILRRGVGESSKVWVG